MKQGAETVSLEEFHTTLNDSFKQFSADKIK